MSRPWSALALLLLLAGCRQALVRPVEPPAIPPIEPTPPSAWPAEVTTTWRLPSPLGEPMELGTVRADGPELVVSQAPVTVRLPDGVDAACLCREQVTSDRFRVFVHHQVAADADSLRFEARIRNLGKQPCELLARQNSLGLSPGPTPARRSWIGRPPEVIGTQAMQAYFASAADLSLHQSLAELSHGPYRLTAEVAAGLTWSWVADFQRPFYDEPDEPVLEVAIYVRRAMAAWPAPEQMALLPAGDEPAACRGRFEHGDRHLTATAKCVGKPQWLDFGGPLLGASGPGLPGEYEELPSQHPGNVGVVYKLHLGMANLTRAEQGLHLLMSAVGGPGGLAFGGSFREPAASWGTLSQYETARVAVRRLPLAKATYESLEWALPGGVSGPQRLYAWPDTLPPPG